MHKKLFFLALILSINTSCKSFAQADNIEDDCIILKIIALSKKEKKIHSKAYLNTNPLNLIGVYNYWKIVDEKTKKLEVSFNGEVKWIFSEKDLDYFKKKYSTWSKKNWTNLCKNDNDFKTSKEYNTIISYPFYNKNRNKAMSTISIKGKGTLIILLEKDKGIWKMVGELTQNFSH